ncbi:hypothetical protein B0H63DRAFT_470188 [Podospora didyma]|uniref:Pentatricopeptide repeat-containing protein n=1 Tax=Podospora didyma TaxID=330526 RepID=A0AAE0NTM3_9PEZI|nr:hypothetical protein B0H63DRAFT_470188 [Podospora didyma]
MKVSSRIDGSICGALRLLPRPTAWATATTTARGTTRAHTSALPADIAARRTFAQSSQSTQSPHSCAGAPAQRSYGNCTSMGEANVESRSSILKCPSTSSSRRRHCPLAIGPAPFLRSHFHDGSFFRQSVPSRCENHTAAATSPSSSGPDQRPADSLQSKPRQHPKMSEQELLNLVEPYDADDPGTVDEHLQFVRDPYMRGYARSDGHDIVIARDKHDVDYPSFDEVTEPNEEERAILWDLRFAVIRRLRNRHEIDLDNVYDLYQRLPEPRMPFIYGRLRHQLLRVLGQPDKRDSKSMMRYFAVISEVKRSGFLLTSGEWNAAMALASRYVGVTTETEVEAAMKLWQEMELEANIKGTDVTFNILFDAASKAGNFVLAEMLYQEMKSRGHRFNRYHHVSLIHFFGLQLDTSGMRAAYREMVKAGEIIDTVVLNAMISGLLRSGEEAAADRVYRRMKATAPDSREAKGTEKKRPVLPGRTYTTNKAITQALMMFAKLGRKHPKLLPGFQNTAPMHPDLQTYRILLNYYSIKVGDISKVAQLVDEMRFYQIPLHGAIFLALFKGYATHGGYERSPWSTQRLDSIWTAFLRAIDDEVPGLEIKTWLAISILQAFVKCATREQVLVAYDELKARWRLDPDDENFMIDYLGSLVNRYYAPQSH